MNTHSRGHVAPTARQDPGQSGLTLLELVVVVAIAAILAMIAVPSYRESITRARRADAITALTDLASRLEQYYSDQNTFATATLATSSATDVLSTTDSPQGYYTLSILPSPDTTATTYKIKATRKGADLQANDTRCGDYTLTNQLVRAVSGTETLAVCWPKN